MFDNVQPVSISSRAALEIKKIIHPNYDADRPVRQELKSVESEPVLQHQQQEEIPVRKTQKSFFDEIG